MENKTLLNQADTVKKKIKRYHKTSGVCVYDRFGQAHLFTPQLPIDKFLDETIEDREKYPILLNWRPLNRDERRTLNRRLK